MEKTRTTIQEIRTQTPDRDVILVGVNSTASLVLQIGIIEPVNFVVCLGFAFNTLNGVRGMADDHILNLLCPVLFVIGEHSQRSRYANFHTNEVNQACFISTKYFIPVQRK